MKGLFFALGLGVCIVGFCAGESPVWTSASYRAEKMPRVYMTYAASKDFEGDIKDLRAHGVEAIEWALNSTNKVEELAILRRYGMRALVSAGEFCHNPAGVERMTGEKAVLPRCIGGAYRGLDVGRNLFSFSPTLHKIIIEPPRHNKNGYQKFSPVAAEVVVPLKLFDGEQHLKIVPATVAVAEPGAIPENDTAGTDEKQKAGRTLYEVSFDLTGLDDALLDKIGVAVYWEDGVRNACVFQEATSVAWERWIEKIHALLTEVGGGTFPSDVVKAMRVGDETFNWTVPLVLPSVSMPYWDFSAPAVVSYERMTGGRWQYPRTVGFPEIYGEEACGAWLYNWHKACAMFVGRAVRKAHALMPGILCMRNTTRGWIYGWENDGDGTGQELLMRELDAGFLDPYPVQAGGKFIDFLIPQDTEYIAGLARRYGNKPLIPWVQAHKFPGLGHPTPDQIDRMVGQHWDIGFDALFWFGYTRLEGPVFGRCELTFPKLQPESWERAGGWNQKLVKVMPPKPVADIAVVRPYTKRAICIGMKEWEKGIRYPADRNLMLALRDIAAKGGHYDVFEVPPVCCESDAARTARAEELKKYKRIIRTEDFE